MLSLLKTVTFNFSNLFSAKLAQGDPLLFCMYATADLCGEASLCAISVASLQLLVSTTNVSSSLLENEVILIISS